MAAAQEPIRKLTDRMPSAFADPRQGAIAIPSIPAILGLTRAASAAVAGDPATFDLDGLRLGMSELKMDAVLKARGLRTPSVIRFVDFESQERSDQHARGDRWRLHAQERSRSTAHARRSPISDVS